MHHQLAAPLRVGCGFNLRHPPDVDLGPWSKMQSRPDHCTGPWPLPLGRNLRVRDARPGSWYL